MLGLLLPTHPVKRFTISCCRGRQSCFVSNPTIFHSVLRTWIFGSPLADGKTDLFVVAPEETIEHVKGWLRL